MNKFREKFLKQLSSFKKGGAITKFQSPAAPLVYQQVTSGKTEDFRPSEQSVKDLYDLSHNGGSGLAYQLINGGLYAAAPFTGGATLPAAIAMSGAAMGSAGSDIADRGLNLENGMDVGFDVLNAAGGAGSALRYLSTANKAADAAVAAGRAYLGRNSAQAAENAVREAAEQAAKQTAKVQSRRDALGTVLGTKATLNPKWRSLNKAAEEAAQQAVYHSSGTPVNVVGRTGMITGEAAQRAAQASARTEAARQVERAALSQHEVANEALRQAGRLPVMYVPWAAGQNAANQVVQFVNK